MIVVECAQGSPEWHAARAGVITASMFGVIRRRVGLPDEKQQKFIDAKLAGAPTKEAMKIAGYATEPRAQVIERVLNGERVGDWSDAAKDYAFRLAIERISGEPLDVDRFETWSMRRGHELEPDARKAHENRIGVAVERAGFVLTDDRLFGCSADGFILPKRVKGAEYKCFLDPSKLRALLLDNDFDDVRDQVHGCLWITGAIAWHLGLYCPALASIDGDLWLREFERDDEAIEALEPILLDFNRFVSKYEERIRAADFSMKRAA